MAIQHGNQRGLRCQRCQQHLNMRQWWVGAARAGLHSRTPVAKQPVGRRDRQQPGAGHILQQLLVRRHGFRRNHTTVSNHKRAARCRQALPVGTAQNSRFHARIHFTHRLQQRTRGEAQVERAAILRLHVLKAPLHDHRQLIHKSRVK